MENNMKVSFNAAKIDFIQCVLIDYIILTKNKTVMSYIDMHEMKKAFLDEMLLGDVKKIEDVLTKLVDSKFVDLFSDDWDKIAKLIFDLLG